MAPPLRRMSSTSMRACRGSSTDDGSFIPQHHGHHCRRHSGPMLRAFGAVPDEAPPSRYFRLNASSSKYSRECRRRTKSESWVPLFKEHDDVLLMNLAATQLLSGCMNGPSHQFVSHSHHSVDLCNEILDYLPETTLCTIYTFGETIRQPTSSTNRSWRSLSSSSCDVSPKLIRGIDGHRSFPSDDSVRRLNKARSAPMTPSTAYDRLASEELDRRLKSIDEASRRDRDHGDRKRRRLCTSEVGGRAHLQALDDDDSVHEFDIMGAWRNARHKGLCQRFGMLFPSPWPSESFSPTEVRTPRSSTLVVYETDPDADLHVT